MDVSLFVFFSVCFTLKWQTKSIHGENERKKNVHLNFVRSFHSARIKISTVFKPDIASINDNNDDDDDGDGDTAAAADKCQKSK